MVIKVLTALFSEKIASSLTLARRQGVETPSHSLAVTLFPSVAELLVSAMLPVSLQFKPSDRYTEIGNTWMV